jgi:hypothetical protein
MRVGNDWSDVAIRNVSDHGMLLSTPEPPKLGTYIEVRRGLAGIVVARIVWRDGDKFGVRARDVIDFAALSAARPTTKPASRDGVFVERRVRERSRDPERFARIGRAVQSIFLVAVAAGMVGSVALWAYQTLARPMKAVQAAMAVPQ